LGLLGALGALSQTFDQQGGENAVHLILLFWRFWVVFQIDAPMITKFYRFDKVFVKRFLLYFSYMSPQNPSP
jgi:hypothetical protein